MPAPKPVSTPLKIYWFIKTQRSHLQGSQLPTKGVELRVDEKAKALLLASGLPLFDATEKDFGTKYTDLIISITVVANTKRSDLIDQSIWIRT